MTAGPTYTPIQTQTLGSSASSVTFNSIPQTYTDLILVTQTKQVSASTYSGINFNADTGSNYSTTGLYGTGSSAISDKAPNRTAIYPFLDFSESTSDFLISTTHIMNYANTTTYKTVLMRANNASQGTEAAVGLWRNTSAITSVQFVSTGTFTAGSTFTLYGIASA